MALSAKQKESRDAYQRAAEAAAGGRSVEARRHQAEGDFGSYDCRMDVRVMPPPQEAVSSTGRAWRAYARALGRRLAIV